MSHPSTAPDYWLGRLTRLRAAQGNARDGVRGPAPHKPLLLLTLLDLAESGKLLGRVLTRTPELTALPEPFTPAPELLEGILAS